MQAYYDVCRHYIEEMRDKFKSKEGVDWDEINRFIIFPLETMVSAVTAASVIGQMGAPIARFAMELLLNFGVVWNEIDKEKRDAYRKAWFSSRNITAGESVWISEAVLKNNGRMHNINKNDFFGEPLHIDISSENFRFVDPFSLTVQQKLDMLSISDKKAFMEQYKIFTAISHAHYIAIWPRWGYPDPLECCCECFIAMTRQGAQVAGFEFDPEDARMRLRDCSGATRDGKG